MPHVPGTRGIWRNVRAGLVGGRPLREADHYCRTHRDLHVEARNGHVLEAEFAELADRARALVTGRASA